MNTLPLQLKLGRVLLVGEGSIASAKYNLLDEMGATIIWWKTHPGEDVLTALAAEQQNLHTRLSLVVVAGFNQFCSDMANFAETQRLLLNQVDNPKRSNVFIPAIVKRDKLRIGIGSGGINPVLARLIRSRIELALPIKLESLIKAAERWNERVRKLLPNLQLRRRFWEKALTDQLPESSCEQQQDKQIEQLLNQTLSNNKQGQVILVGAGPGDASLITLKGLRALQQADVVLYDKLISLQVLNYARRDAVFEDVGKRRGHCPMPQQDICKRIITLAQQGKIVCRLKGGDPAFFARSGEEVAALAAAGIAHQIVPGITSASAVAASLGIPLTHRELAHSVRLITGHQALSNPSINFGALIEKQETLVVYMGFSQLESLTNKLLDAGVASDMPIVMVQNATLPQQRNHYGKLAKAIKLATELNLADGPILLIIGKVVKLHTQQQPHTSLSQLVDRISSDWITPQSVTSQPITSLHKPTAIKQLTQKP